MENQVIIRIVDEDEPECCYGAIITTEKEKKSILEMINNIISRFYNNDEDDPDFDSDVDQGEGPITYLEKELSKKGIQIINIEDTAV